MTAQRTRRLITAATIVAIGMLGLVSGSGASSASPTAHAAKTVNVTENATLHLTRKSGSTLYERGTATGTLPGNVTARFNVELSKVTGSVTIYPKDGGSVTINVVGYARSLAVSAPFSGSLAVRRGTGRFARALGSGTFSGTVNRHTWDVSVVARAKLTY